MKLKRFNENINSEKLPTKEGWYWILLKGFDIPTPCWYIPPYNKSEDEGCFLPAGLGDTSRYGIYIDDIERVGPKIDAPVF